MNLRQIRYFVAVAEELHFGRAAARLNIVQPAISHQIGLLEETLGVRLLERSSRTVALTDAGEAFLIEARLAVQHASAAAQMAKDVARGLLGQLTIGFVDNAIWSGLPEIIHAFQAKFPGLTINLVQMARGPQLAALQSGELDIAILPGPLVVEGIDTDELARVRLDVVLPADHPLAAKTEVDIADLAETLFIGFPSVADPRRIDEIITGLCASAGFTPKFGQPVQQMQTAISLVSAGLGIAIVPQWMREAWARNVSYRPLTPSADYVLLLARAATRRRPAITAFCELAVGQNCTPSRAP